MFLALCEVSEIQRWTRSKPCSQSCQSRHQSLQFEGSHSPHCPTGTNVTVLGLVDQKESDLTRSPRDMATIRSWERIWKNRSPGASGSAREAPATPWMGRGLGRTDHVECPTTRVIRKVTFSSLFAHQRSHDNGTY